jgi:pyruvate/2-oxoglutarate dehydrogenase complex dihydrolipoamide acyltransferase (E2) component
LKGRNQQFRDCPNSHRNSGSHPNSQQGETFEQSDTSRRIIFFKKKEALSMKQISLIPEHSYKQLTPSIIAREKQSRGLTCTPPSPWGQGTSTGPGPCRSTGTGTWTLNPRLAPWAAEAAAAAAAAAAALSCGNSAAAAAAAAEEEEEDEESGWSASSREIPRKPASRRKRRIAGEAAVSGRQVGAARRGAA